MPRQPLSWAEWTASALSGAKRETKFDYEKMRAQRVREAQEQKEVEAAARAAEIAEARQEGARLAFDQAKAEALATEERLCAVCLENERSVVLEPCGHLCLCKECSSRIDKCPFCRQTPTRRLSVFD